MPTSGYIPRFRNVYRQETDFLRGYATSFYSGRSRDIEYDGFGQQLRDNLTRPSGYGPWYVSAGMMGETIPKETNKVTLDKDLTDSWGIPQLRIDITHDDNDEKMIADFFEQFTEMFDKAGFNSIVTRDTQQAPGLDIHEMGGARMGHDPETSILNEWNQIHKCPNVFVTDGACMTSVSTQNPSLTFMALTARAANHAIRLLKDDAF